MTAAAFKTSLAVSRLFAKKVD